MPLVGLEEDSFHADDQLAYRPAGDKPGTYLFFYPATEKSQYSQEHPGLQHLAFMVRTRSAVNTVHQAVAELAPQFGGRVLHEPQEFPAVSAAVLRHLLARPLSVHAGSGHHNRA